MAPMGSASSITARRWPASSGPGSMTTDGHRPTIHVFVPSSVNGPALGASTRIARIIEPAPYGRLWHPGRGFRRLRGEPAGVAERRGRRALGGNRIAPQVPERGEATWRHDVR